MDTDEVSPLPGYFQDLQQEKKKLEYKLDQLRIRKKDIEAKQDAVAKKNLALTQKHDNMKRTVDVAKRKCQETQLYVDKLQKVNDHLQTNIQKIKDDMKSEEKNKEMLIKSYLDKYADLAQCFRDAKRYYVEPVLEEEEKSRRDACTDKDIQVKSFEETVNMVTSQLEKALLENNSPSDERPQLCEWSEFLLNKDRVLELFTEENNQVTTKDEKLRSSVAEYHKELEQI